MSIRKWISIGLLLGLPFFASPQPGFVQPAAAATTAAPIDLNTATADQLETLPGIGPAKAKAIIEGRPYKSLKDFESRGIVPASTVDKFKDQVSVARAKPAATEAATTTAAPAGKIDLNTATEDELQTLPGIGPAKAKAIIEGRPYKSLKDFESRGIVAASTVEKMKGQLAVSKAAKPAATEAATTTAAPAGKVDLNIATEDELQALPGIGPAKAKAIIEGRPYTSLKDFESRGILPASTLEKVKGQLAVSKALKPAATEAAATTAAPAGKVDLNTATEDELQALPGIGPAKAKAIIEGRPYTSLKDFESRGIVAASTLEKVKGQLAVSKAAKPAATEAATTPAEPGATIDLNSATVDELQSLPGIGPAKANAIAEGRPYRSLKDFESRGIVAASTFDKFKDQVTVTKPRPAVAETPEEKSPVEPVGKIDLNSATAEELEVLPGVGPARAKAIVEGRPYTSLAQFESKGIVPASIFDKFKGATEVAGASGKAAPSSQGTPGQIAAQKRIRMCGAKWRAAKAEDKIPSGMSWPQYWSQCNTALKNRGY